MAATFALKAKTWQQSETLVDSKQNTASNGSRSLLTRDISCNQIKQVTFIWTPDSNSDHRAFHKSTEQHTADPRGLTFSWWGCYDLCLRHKPAKLAHSFYSVLVPVSVFIALSTVFQSINSPDTSPLCHFSSGLILVLSTIYLFMTVFLSRDIIICGWLGLKHQLTN